MKTDDKRSRRKKTPQDDAKLPNTYLLLGAIFSLLFLAKALWDFLYSTKLKAMFVLILLFVLIGVVVGFFLGRGKTPIGAKPFVCKMVPMVTNGGVVTNGGKSVEINEGQSVEFRAIIEGGIPPYTYQWFKRRTDQKPIAIAGATSILTRK